MKFKKLSKVLLGVVICATIGTITSKAITLEEVKEAIYARSNKIITFDENTERVYYINSEGKLFDSKGQEMATLPDTIRVKELLEEYYGIGVYIALDENGDINLVGTIEDSPAAKLIEPNDILVSIDGEDVRGKMPTEVSEKIRGEEGTEVELGLLRNGKEITVKIERQKIEYYSDNTYFARTTQKLEDIDKTQDGKNKIVYSTRDISGKNIEFVITLIVDTTDSFMNKEDVNSTENVEEQVVENENNVLNNETVVEENNVIEDESVVEDMNNTEKESEEETTVNDSNEVNNEVNSEEVNDIE